MKGGKYKSCKLDWIIFIYILIIVDFDIDRTDDFSIDIDTNYIW
jgi:hypothetical protein